MKNFLTIWGEGMRVTLTGEKKNEVLEGLKAIAFQHELDHLNGVMFFDYLSPFKKRRLLEKFNRLH